MKQQVHVDVGIDRLTHWLTRWLAGKLTRSLTKANKHSLTVSRTDWFPYKPRHVKTNKVIVRTAKTQISMGIHPVWSESSLCASWVAKDPTFLHADSENSDQTGRMPRLI